MNALIYWKTKESYLEKFANTFNLQFCAYYYEEMEEQFGNLGDSFYGIHVYENIDDLLKKSSIRYPVDGEVMERFKPYETQAMGIINRWRRSACVDETYLGLRDSYFKYLQYWYDFIFSHKIDLFVMTFEPHIPMTYFPYAICKAFKIPVIIAAMMPIIGGKKLNYCLEESLESLEKKFDSYYAMLRKEYEDTDKEIALPDYLEAYFSMYLKSNQNVERVIYYNKKESIFDKGKVCIERAKIYISQGRYRSLAKKARYYLSANAVSRPVLKYAQQIEESPRDERFFVYFLHLQPECTTLPKGGDFENQLLSVKMISKCLPEGVYLYVKEHPAYWNIDDRRESILESRNKHFYDELRRLPNVRLIDHKYSSLTLMDNALCVVTITGTAGFEAMFKRKPVIVFANAVYAHYKYVYNIRTTSECQNAVNEILEGKEQGTLRDVKIFLKALEPIVFQYGCDEKEYNDNGVPAPSDEDFQMFIEKISEFYRSNYENSL